MLDDVVMSVDSSHRRRFAELLKTEFPNVQFVITTHDEVWARQMRSAGLVTSRAMARFHGWTVDAGPTYGDGDAWNAIEADLGKGDIAGAARQAAQNSWRRVQPTLPRASAASSYIEAMLPTTYPPSSTRSRPAMEPPWPSGGRSPILGKPAADRCHQGVETTTGLR